MKPLAVLALAAALAIPGVLRAQTPNAVTEVQGLAPQLVAFAGSTANFQNLVNGLALGTPVTLVAATPTGQLQTVSFTPAGTMSSLQIAQTLERARQALITRGVGAPTPEQIGIALVGGTLPTPAGGVAVTSLLPANTAATTSSASTGTSATLTPTGAASLQVTTRPLAASTLGTPTGAAVSGATSATPATAGNTSDTTSTTNTSTTPVLPTPATTNQPSPAAQIQQRR